jgi:hypothetical protein
VWYYDFTLHLWHRREKVRSYGTKAANANVLAPDVSPAPVEVAAQARMSIWISLIYLQHALIYCDDTQRLAAINGLHTALSELMRVSGFWLMSASIRSSSNSNSTSNRSADSTEWIPSSSDIAAAIFVLSCAYVHGNTDNKSALGLAQESHFALLESSGNSGNSGLVHHLLSLGLSRGVSIPCRWLSLTLATSLVNNKDNAQYSHQKLALSNLLVINIQKQVHNIPSTDSGDVLSYLIDLLAASMTADAHLQQANKATSYVTSAHAVSEVVTLPSIPFDRTHGYGASGSGSSAAGDGPASSSSSELTFKTMPLPMLIQWISETSSAAKPRVLAAIARCIGRIGNSNALFTKNRLLANVTSDVPMQLLLDLASYHNPTAPQTTAFVVTTALVALWTTIHASEQAKATTKSLLKDNEIYREAVLPDASAFSHERLSMSVTADSWDAFLVSSQDRARSAFEILL